VTATDATWRLAHEAVTAHGALQKSGELGALMGYALARGVKLVLEIGSDKGGTLWAWRQLGADVIAVSLPRGPYGTGRRLIDHGATVIAGDSHRLATWATVGRVLAGRLVDMLFIDGDHSEAGVEQDLMGYGRYVASGGLIALHDICRHRRPDVGVSRVWANTTGLDGWDRMELIDPPDTWGGIGVLTMPWT
jgi:hypothetical protein